MILTGERIEALERQYEPHSIHFDSDEDVFVCGVCSATVDPCELHSHCESAPHLAALEELEGFCMSEWCPITLNGFPMVLDHHCLYPHTMFGPGCGLWDESLHALIATDVSRAVQLMPHHSYTVVCLQPSDSCATGDATSRSAAVKEHFDTAAHMRNQLPNAHNLLLRFGS